ncbi:MAG: hypothetical protein PVH48_06985 [Cyclobacteriaceae bacterium]|jgi:hypothetical protein
MKKLTALFVVFVLFSIGFIVNAQEEEDQIFYCYEEIVSPDRLEDYWELAKEIVELCKENQFPYTFYAWTTGDFKYQLWTPIKTLDDIDKMNEAWVKLLEGWDQEKLNKFRKTKITNYSFTMNIKNELNYQPENSRLAEGEGKFVYWQEYYLFPGVEEEAEALAKEAVEILKSKNHDNGWNFGYGGLGYESPCMIVWIYGKDRHDYWEQDKKFNDMYPEVFKEINSKFIPLIRTKKSKDMWYLEELSYVVEEE